MVGRFDDCCPYCTEKQDVYATFQDRDYNNEFHFECNNCGKVIVVDVTMDPVFELNKEESIKEKDRWGYGLPRLKK